MQLRLLFFLMLFVFGLFCSFNFLNFFNNIKNFDTSNKELIEGIAVLTGGKGRIAKGVELFKNTPNSYLIISGVDKNIKNIEVLSKELLENNRVFIDKKSETTIDNAEEIIKWAYKKSITNIKIITSDYHMPRSMLILKKKSKNLKFFAGPVTSDISVRENLFNNFQLLIFLSEEYLKYLFCYLVL